MTREQFDELIDTAEKISGRTFPKEWRDARYPAVADVTPESFELKMLPAMTTGGPVELDLEGDSSSDAYPFPESSKN